LSTGLHVFLLARPPADVDLRGRARIAAQSALARRALALSAASCGAVLGMLEKDGEDAPLPSHGWHWSLSHSTGFAAGAVCPAPVGIDVEEIRPRRVDVVGRVSSRAELELLGGFSWHAFVRVWTAKEAVLKKAGVGLLELAWCRLVAAPDENRLIVHHRGRDHVVRQSTHAEHVAAVTHDGAELGLTWSWTGGEPGAIVAAARSNGGRA
jgi:4'-phosphopantetheinyl transferase